MIKLASKEERKAIKNDPATKARIRKIGWIIGALTVGAIVVANAGVFLYKTNADKKAENPEAQLEKISAVEYLYEKDGSTVSLYNSPCQNPNHSKALSEELNPAANLLKHLIVEGVNGQGDGCWLFLQKTEEVAMVSDVDSNISILELSEFKKPPSEEARQQVLSVSNSTKDTEVFIKPATELVKAEAELAKMPAMDGLKTLFPENVEYFYEKDGSKVTLYRDLCEFVNGIGYAMSKSEHVKDIKNLTPKNLTFEGPNGKTKGCWIYVPKANGAAIATIQDPEVSVINLGEFKKNGPAPKPLGWENRQAVLEVIRKEKVPKIFGSTANLKKENGYYAEAATDDNGIPDTTVGHAEWYLFNFDPKDGSCAEGNPKFAYALEQKYRQSFVSAQHGTSYTLLRPSEGADYISYKTSSVCYFLQGDEVLIVGAYKPIRISADVFKTKANLNGKAL